jgi:hypothetical protein
VRRLDVRLILVAAVAFVIMCLAAAVIGFFPRPVYGFGFSPHSGAIRMVVPGGSAAAAGVSAGDRIIDVPHGDGARGYRLLNPRLGDTVRVATRRGVVRVVATPRPVAFAIALADTLNLLSSIAVCLFATLLYVRRPGPMALGFWFFSLGITVPSIYPLCGVLPEAFGLGLVAVNDSISAFIAGLVLIPFALRFPSGVLPARCKTLERVTWSACILVFVYTVFAGNGLNFGGVLDDRSTALLIVVLSVAPLPIPAGILIYRYARSSPEEQAKSAWAIAGFGGAIATTVLVWAGWLIFNASQDTIAFDVVDALAGAGISLFPLLAIYPIVRFQLFDLGFVINRAALYSTLTLAAVGTLAGINWLAQHFVTERLALILQPLAAIALGLGYLRVREATQRFIERTIFRRRFAAERHFAALRVALPNIQSTAQLNATLLADVRETLALRSAALFRMHAGAFVLDGSVGWDGTAFAIPPATVDDRVFDESPAHLMERLRGAPAAALPKPSDEPVAAFALRSGAAVTGFVLYGRHVNGTAIDPEEAALIRELCDAAGAAYGTAELQAELARLRAEVAEVRELLAAERSGLRRI